MGAIIEGFYPVAINEARYGGTYAGGEWVLTAGIRFPRNTDAFGGDSDCMVFWSDLEGEDNPHGSNGPTAGVVETEDALGASKGNPEAAIFASGHNPVDVLERARKVAEELEGQR